MVESHVSNRPSAAWPAKNHEQDLRPQEDIVAYAREYARERPEIAALWCFGFGFILGWKLKPW